MKSKAQREKKAAALEREIRAFGSPSNPKAATAQWGLVMELARVLDEPVGTTKRRLWPRPTQD
jgi:hypothetical protein